MTYTQALENFRIAKTKVNSWNHRYDALRDKYTKIANDCGDAYCREIASLGNDIFRFRETTTTFDMYLNGVKVFDSDYYTYDLNKSKNYAEFKAAFEKYIVRAIGTYLFNRFNNGVTLEDITTLNEAAKSVLDNLTEEFYNNFMTIEERNKKAMNRYYTFKRACDKRDNAADRTYYELVNVWRKEEGLKAGNHAFVTTGSRWERCRVIASTKEGKNGTIVYFTDGTRTNASNIDYTESFRMNTNISRY